MAQNLAFLVFEGLHLCVKKAGEFSEISSKTAQQQRRVK
jgi:hypothetical protein